MNDRGNIDEQAAAWHVATAGDDMDWDGFTVWLEADPRHRIAYDETALGDAILDDHIAALNDRFAEPQAASAGIRKPGWRSWAAAGIAASLIAVVAIQNISGSADTVYATGNTGKQVPLADGSRIELAPHSRLAIDGNGSHLALEGGAYFIIRHDPHRIMTVSAGPIRISDIGTEFDVQVQKNDVRVEVRDGQLQIASKHLSHPIGLAKGAAMMFDSAEGKTEISEANPADIGAWRDGRLIFANTPLPLVAADLSRYTGLDLTVENELQGRRFSGTLAISDGKKAFTDLARLMGLDLRRDGRGYRLGPAVH